MHSGFLKVGLYCMIGPLSAALVEYSYRERASGRLVAEACEWRWVCESSTCDVVVKKYDDYV